MSYTYQWRRCDASGAMCADIVGEVGGSYLLTDADIGSTLRVVVSDGTSIVTSAQTAVIGAVSSLGSALDAFFPALGPSDSGHTTVVAAGADLVAAARAANPGDTLLLRGGTRAVDLERVHFSAAHPVTIKAYPGETVTWSGGVHGFYGGDLTGIRLDARDGMIFTGCGNCGFKLDNAQDFELLGGEVYLNNKNGGLVNGEGSLTPPGWTNQKGYRIRIDGTLFHNNGLTDTQAHNLYFGGGSAHSSTQAGVDTFIVCNCVSYGIGGGYCYQFGGMAWNGIVANNTGDDNGKALVNSDQPGIFVIYNQSDQPWPSRNIVIVNNLATNSPTHGFQGSGGNPGPGNVVRSNMGHSNAGGTYSPVWGGHTEFTLGTNYADADPEYVSLAGHDFHLQGTSPAIGDGEAAYTPPLDRDGVARAHPTLGAYAA